MIFLAAPKAGSPCNAHCCATLTVVFPTLCSTPSRGYCLYLTVDTMVVKKGSTEDLWKVGRAKDWCTR